MDDYIPANYLENIPIFHQKTNKPKQSYDVDRIHLFNPKSD